jgi:hypothetical protein
LRGFGEDAIPAELRFKEIGVAEIDAIGRAEFDEITAAFQMQFGQYEDVLPQLGAGVREKPQKRNDQIVGLLCEEEEVCRCAGIRAKLFRCRHTEASSAAKQGCHNAMGGGQQGARFLQFAPRFAKTPG